MKVEVSSSLARGRLLKTWTKMEKWEFSKELDTIARNSFKEGRLTHAQNKIILSGIS